MKKSSSQFQPVESKNISMQSDVLSALDGTSKLLFITGRAGTGKSTLLRELCERTKRNYVVLAPTGIAAVNVQGATIHSFFRFKPGITVEEARRSGARHTDSMYDKLELLIIDEVSMVRADMMDCIDIFLRAARKSDFPFGGVKVVLFGDLYQLEPVVKSDEKQALLFEYKSAYFFSSRVFKSMLMHPTQLIEFVELTTVYRQKDKEFINLLDDIRKKRVTDRQLYELNNRVDEFIEDTLQEYIYVTSTNETARRINQHNLETIQEEPFHLIGNIDGDFSEKYLPTELIVEVKIGARVMLLNNDPDGRWMNGSLGTVMAVAPKIVTVLLDNGMQYDVTQNVWSNYKYTFNNSKGEIEKEVVGAFSQFPLKLAWAITVHKSQGQTFDRVVIWFEGRAFAHGQVYVALSRCRTLEGIVLKRPFTHFDILMDDMVRHFLIAIKKYILRWKLPLHQRKAILENALLERFPIEMKRLTDEDEIETIILLPDRIEGETLIGVNQDTQEETTTLIDAIVEIIPLPSQKGLVA